MPSDYHRIETAIRRLEARFDGQPKVENLAAVLELSPLRTQRLFRRWASITPQRFLQVLTIDYAKTLLDDSRNVLAAALETGPGRLHDRMINLEAVRLDEYRSDDEGLTITYGLHASPFGHCLIAVTPRGVCRLSFLAKSEQASAVRKLAEKWPDATLRQDRTKTVALVKSVFSTRKGTQHSKINLLLRGTHFQLKVWRVLLRIPPGRALSYRDVACAIGRPASARAVGNAVGANPIAYLIPCHRVIRGNGRFGYYSGGPARKKAILAREAGRRYSSSAK
jgi:AraC family transcriptional regulator of adaptative response/methylated-DNA-[protein]-cysteine methyltransferase